jgi:gas vesicle protein
MNQGSEHGYEEDSGVGFMAGLFTGVAIGAGLGLLFAPRRGSEFRQGIADSAATASRAVKDTYRQASDAAGGTIEEITTRGRQVYDQARKVVTQARQDVGRTAEEAMKTVEDSASSAREFISKNVPSDARPRV